MQYGYFDDKQREFVITRPDTPLPWINYLGTEDFFGIISNTAGGYSFYKDARLRRLTRYRYNNVPLDGNGRYLYIKDGDMVWNPMWKPMRIPLDSYECRHGLTYTKIMGAKNGLEVEIIFFIPPGFHNEVWDIRIRNLSKESKDVRIWSFIEWCLWDAFDDMTNFQRNFSTGEVEIEEGTIFHVTEFRERRNHYAYFYCSYPTSGYDSSRDAFVGVHYGLEMPQVVKEGRSRNSRAFGWAPIGSHQMDFTLKPGDEERFHILLGYAESPPEKKFTAPGVANKEQFYRIRDYFAREGSVDNEFARLCNFWNDLLTVYRVQSEDENVDRMVNIWNQYQCMVTFNISRSASFYESGISRGMGFRDSNQDILGFVHLIPERARERIIDLAATQLSDGTCFHQYQPLTKQGNSDIGGGFNDDPLWLVLATAAYIRETGDASILKEKVPYADNKEADSTLLDHLELSIRYTLRNLGPHGLPLIGHADWNDCLNLNCFSTNPDESFQLAGDVGNTAESVMIAGLFCYACEDMAGIYRYIEDDQKADEVLKYAEKMRKTIYQYGWDGEWFLRAYDAHGNKVGSKENEEGKIFIESQGWCIMGKAGLENGYAEKALDSVKKWLASEDGIILQQPAFQTYHVELGEISSYPPGYKENAGIFTHNNTWVQIAETMIGRGDQAMNYYLSICPAKKLEKVEIYRAEPYVYSQMTAGRDAPTPGEGKNSWLSGTAAWSFVVIAQHILGIRPDFDGLIIDPCIPAKWKEYRVFRRFRNATYEIRVSNPDAKQKGVKELRIDGKIVKGNKVPVHGDNKNHLVEVILG